MAMAWVLFIGGGLLWMSNDITEITDPPFVGGSLLFILAAALYVLGDRDA